MTSYADLGTGAVGYGTVAGVVESLGDLGEKRAAANGGAPCRGIHVKLLEVAHVDDNGAVWASETVVRVRVSAASRLHLEVVVNGAFDDLSNLLCRVRICDCRRRFGNA